MIEKSLFAKNPSLEPISILIGKWNVKMSHKALTNPLTWQASFEWLDNAFIIGRWDGKNEIPRSIFIMGRNENKPDNEYIMFSYDSRGVSRIYDMSFENGVWKFWREDSDFFSTFRRQSQ